MAVVSGPCDSRQPDLSNHFSSEARSTLPNPMKSMWKLIANQSRPDVISLANGDPHPTLFPLRKVEFEVPSVAEGDPVPAWRNGTGPSQTFVSYKDESGGDPSLLSLKSAFQYTHADGLPQTQRALTELTQFFHSPPRDHIVTLSLGNADGVSKAFRLFGDRGDHFLTESFGFPGMTNAPLSYGIKWIGIKMDEGGLVPEDMEKILMNWDPARGRRPHVLYVVPCGQNPTGTSLSVERRRKIYDICQRYDLIIIEDDPYYFLQYDIPSIADTNADTYWEEFAKSFLPSFLSMDVDGRVVRLDSFSKVLAPGMRLGWITTSNMLHEKLVNYIDSATQHPHALGQIFVAEMLGNNGWRIDGFCRWMKSLCEDYRRRRDFLLEVFHREIGPSGYATARTPQAGMFVWIEVHLDRHPRRSSVGIVEPSTTSARNGRTNIPALMEELFHRLVDSGVIVMPASIFAVEEDIEAADVDDRVPIGDRLNFVRVTFCGTEETIEAGILRFCRVLKEFFNGGLPS